MTTLATDTPRAYELGDVNEIPVVASDIIYEGAAVGVVKASGHARPLTSADKFAGFAEAKADNSAGSAAAINVRVKRKGKIELSVTGAVITDLNQPVYASDDNTFTFVPTSAVFIGFLRRFVSSGVGVVEFDVDSFVDPYDGLVKETISTNKTLDAQDVGKVMFIDTDATVTTLPATATAGQIMLVNIGAYGTVAVTVSPQATDKIMGPDYAGADDTDLVNTKATAQRGDYVILESGHADGWKVNKIKGVWA